MDILVTYPDGTTELRAANSLCVLDFESPPRAPHVAKHADIEGWCLDGRIARQIGHVRGSPFSWAWRLTGHTEEPYTLTGEWQSARIETVDEQIERLTRERDTEQGRAAARQLWWSVLVCACEQQVIEVRRDIDECMRARNVEMVARGKLVETGLNLDDIMPDADDVFRRLIHEARERAAEEKRRAAEEEALFARVDAALSKGAP